MESRDDTVLIAERLAALPLETPPAAAWSAIRSQLLARSAAPARRRTPSPWWLALAAALAAVVVAPSLRQVAQTPPLAPAEAPAVAALMQRSQALEREIRGLRAQAPAVDDVQYQWERAIESDLALVDVGLTARGDQTEPLWRERVRLLEELKTATQTDTGPLLLQARLD